MAEQQTAEQREDFSTFGFFKSFLLPSITIFIVPVLSLIFFLHAQTKYDAELQEGVVADIRADGSLTEEEREAQIDFFQQVPFSTLIQDPDFAEQVDTRLLWELRSFYWGILLSACCIGLGIFVFVLAGICVLLSMRSQKIQYFSLAAGWHVLRFSSAFQTVVQGILLVGLSFWVTALWMNMYIPKLILIVALVVVGAIVAVLRAIFQRPDTEFAVEGVVLDEQAAGPIWQDLRKICDQLETEPPDQLVAGIDDNFFVTEHPVMVNDTEFQGRTLYVSLSLLKQLSDTEAAAVMAHEMAHFSGNDTTFSRKITPLLARYGNYLGALSEGGITIPIFYFMLFFRSLFQLSLGKLSRKREFRADKLASEVTSADDVAGALLRIAAYATYRGSVEQELFDNESALEVADISDRIEQGFSEFAVAFADKDDLADETMSHPFDSHPPLAQRLEAVGLSLSSELKRKHLSHSAASASGQNWFHRIAEAETLERTQWDKYEHDFRKFHLEVLAYRYAPANEEELKVVKLFFPELSFAGKKVEVTIDHEKIHASDWEQPAKWVDVSSCSIDDSNVLTINVMRAGLLKSYGIQMRHFDKAKQQELLEAVSKYLTRQEAAKAYQEEKDASLATADGASSEAP